MSICNLDHFEEAYWQDKRFVLVGGCFDPLHDGHLAYFRLARVYGPLVCAVESDATVAKKRPVLLPALTRLKVLNACRDVEHVHLAVEGVPAVIRALKPSHYVTGIEYAQRLPLETVQACAETETILQHVDCRQGASSAYLAGYERQRTTTRLAAFEAFVSTQAQPTAWQPVTDYSAAARRVIETPNADRIAESFAGCTVLDYGCGYGCLVQLLSERGMHATGWDPQFAPNAPKPISDLVICREVLEHVPVRLIPSLVEDLVVHARRFIYVTTRFTTGSHLLDVDGSDDLDPTHISMLNPDLLRTLFVLAGCQRRADLEARLDHQGKGRVLVYERA